MEVEKCNFYWNNGLFLSFRHLTFETLAKNRNNYSFVIFYKFSTYKFKKVSGIVLSSAVLTQ
jgi:hypothetical protein